MLILGGLIKVREMILAENLLLGLEKTLPSRHHHLIPMNKKALEIGKNLIKRM
jgi:2-oxoglutarate ferredoxin oxidoreductase subunit gamma